MPSPLLGYFQTTVRPTMVERSSSLASGMSRELLAVPSLIA
jgi:hypothetical protein